MIPKDAHKLVLPQSVHAGYWVRTVADDVPEGNEVIGALVFRGDQDRLEGFEVGVYVCEDGVFHRAIPATDPGTTPTETDLRGMPQPSLKLEESTDGSLFVNRLYRVGEMVGYGTDGEFGVIFLGSLRDRVGYRQPRQN